MRTSHGGDVLPGPDSQGTDAASGVHHPLVSCDIVRQDCPAEKRCIELLRPGNTCGVECWTDSMGTAVQDEPCKNPDDCAKGHGCVDAGDGFKCSRYCLDNADCTAGTTCYRLSFDCADYSWEGGHCLKVGD